MYEDAEKMIQGLFESFSFLISLKYEGKATYWEVKYRTSKGKKRKMCFFTILEVIEFLESVKF